MAIKDGDMHYTLIEAFQKKSPTYSQMESFLEKINIFYEEANDNLTKCLLSFLKVHCLFLDYVILSINPPSSTSSSIE